MRGSGARLHLHDISNRDDSHCFDACRASSKRQCRPKLVRGSLVRKEHGRPKRVRGRPKLVGTRLAPRFPISLASRFERSKHAVYAFPPRGIKTTRSVRCTRVCFNNDQVYVKDPNNQLVICPDVASMRRGGTDICWPVRGELPQPEHQQPGNCVG